MENSYANPKHGRMNRKMKKKNKKKASPIRIITPDLNLIVKAKTNIIQNIERCMPKPVRF